MFNEATLRYLINGRAQNKRESRRFLLTLINGGQGIKINRGVGKSSLILAMNEKRDINI